MKRNSDDITEKTELHERQHKKNMEEYAVRLNWKNSKKLVYHNGRLTAS